MNAINTKPTERELSTEPLKPDRTYKDRLFRMIFKEKEQFLELYNAMNGTSYENPEELTVTTLENAVYMGMRNDVSFLLYEHLTLYEHQASVNPNMPLRNLFYVADIYSRLTADANLYSSSLIPLPSPQFVVFYNGQKAQPEQTVLHLSDAFQEQERAKLELEVLVLNINPGFNETLMKGCRTLYEYTLFVSRVRTYSQDQSLADAVEQAIQECISEGILSDFLIRNRAEVKKMSIYEYNEEKHMQQEREEAMEKGRLEGLQEGHRQGRAEGLTEGLTTARILLIQANKKKGVDEASIADFLGEELSFVHRVFELIDQEPNAGAEKILKLLGSR